jgi:hypothetical protein
MIRLHTLREVLRENKEFIIGPALTLIPQLFSLPLFIVSIAFICQEIETNPLRYLLIVSYLISFIPQFTTFIHLHSTCNSGMRLMLANVFIDYDYAKRK